MSTLLYAQPGNVPPDQANVRSTVTMVQADAPASVSEQSPEYNEFASDPITEGGLTGHQLASKVTAGTQYAPAVGNANEDMSARVDNQISTSGTAAGREAAGEWGHGSLLITEGIEPTIQDGQQFTEMYFKAPERPIQDTAGHEMSLTDSPDSGTRAAAQATGARAARAAVMASQYSAFYAASQGE